MVIYSKKIKMSIKNIFRKTSFILLIFLVLSIFSLDSIKNSYSYQIMSSLSLKNALLYSLKYNKLIKIAGLKLKSSGYEENEALSGFFPKINFNEIYMNTDNPLYAFGSILNQRILTNQNAGYYFSPSFLNNPGMIHNYESNIQIEQPIFEGGKIYLGYKRALLHKNALKNNLNETRQKVLFNVAKAYYSADFAYKYVRLMKNMVKTMRVYKKTSKNLYKEGQVVSSDVLRAKVQLASMKEKLLNAKKNYKLARYYLNIMIGLPIDTKYRLSSQLAFDTDFRFKNIKYLQKEAFLHRPDFRALILNKKNMSLGITEAEGKFLPKIAASYNYYSNGPTLNTKDAYSYNFMIMLHLNIFSGLYDYNNLEKSKTSYNTISEYEGLLKNKIELQVRKAYLKYKTDVESSKVAKLAVLNAGKTLKITSNRYKAGITTLINLDKTLDEFKQSKLNYINALYKLSLDRYYIKLVTGTLNPGF